MLYIHLLIKDLQLLLGYCGKKVKTYQGRNVQLNVIHVLYVF